MNFFEPPQPYSRTGLASSPASVPATPDAPGEPTVVEYLTTLVRDMHEGRLLITVAMIERALEIAQGKPNPSAAAAPPPPPPEPTRWSAPPERDEPHVPNPPPPAQR